MWAKAVIFVLCSQIFVRNLSEAQTLDEEIASKTKSKYLKNSGVSPKKAKLESFTTVVNEDVFTGDISDLPPEVANDTIKQDHHRYYNSTFYSNPEDAKAFWLNIDDFPNEQVVTNKMLSNSHRQATTIELSFEFPFYGTWLRNITLATGGFLYMGDYMHNWIAATQYVAPLMANFDTTMSENSTVKYADNGTLCIVQWSNVYIKDKKEDGSFTFQVQLFQNGDICFAYKEIPFAVEKINDDNHPVKVGISDAYILERNVFFIRRKTIYEYHRADMMMYPIASNTAIYFTALPTCLRHRDCNSCMNSEHNLECKWCEPVQRCSDGIDRQRQSWIVNACPTRPIVCPEIEEIPEGKPNDSSPKPNERSELPASINSNQIHVVPFAESSEKGYESIAPYVQDEYTVRNSGAVNIGVIIAIVVFIAAVLAVGSWIFYAYRFPQSSSGQFLIKYRPSQWNLKLEDHSITADSFHM